MLEKITTICAIIVTICYFVIGVTILIDNINKYKLAIVSLLYAAANLLLFLSNKK